ncbi:hypothetical protein [Brachybacterium sp. ACRRE]|uniref:hypothetical protein n=1 Tax=Brachybacterium sp. ACRRE TaxID=2918184 RepID=UPI001EF32450|nr:hypothetical protein [Brachybacterium sp. ACRRE]MCG7310593.1 hypothetical protein [Brachybacterium sp. ACRRE]
MRSTLESIAQLLADLGHVSRAQWALRLLAALSLVAAQLLACAGHPLDGVLPALTSAAVLVGGLVQTLRPDSSMGTLALAGAVVAACASADVTVLAGVAVLVLVTHVCWSLTAMVPAHGTIGRRALTTTVRWAAAAVLLALAAGLGVVLPLAGASTPAWTMVLGILALIALVAVLVVPHGTSPRRGR